MINAPLPNFVPIDFKSVRPDIDDEHEYLVKVDGHWYVGEFVENDSDEDLIEWEFDDGRFGHCLDGSDGSKFEAVYRIEDGQCHP